MKLRWVERTFDFDYPVELAPDVVERVRGTPPRLEDRIGALPREILTRRLDETWSIQENAGHLLDLEPLMHRRLDEFLAGASALSAADMGNRATNDANHNARPIKDILGDFRRERESLLARVDALSDADFSRSAVHPRLKKPMRLVDWLLFTACHDDYHLARITELMRIFKSRG